MQGRRRERFFYLLLAVVALLAVAVIAWKVADVGWSDATTEAREVVAGQARAAAFFSFL